MGNLCGMVIWRPTVRLAAKLRLQLAETALRSDTRLGDWYAADLTLGRCRLVLCVSTLSRLGVVLPAAPYATLPERLGPAVGRLLLHLGADARAVEREVGAMGTIAVAKTCSRSVLGTIKEFSWMLQLRHEAEPVTPELDPLLLGVELMVAAVNVALVHHAAVFADPEAMAAVAIFLAVAAAEAVVGLSLILRVLRAGRGVDAAALSELRG